MSRCIADLSIAAAGVVSSQALNDISGAFTAFCAGVYVLAQAYRLAVEAKKNRPKK
jgi:hypothetical protein